MNAVTLVVRRVRPACGAALSSIALLWISAGSSAGAAKSAADVRAQVLHAEATGDLAGAQSLLKEQAGTPGSTGGIEALAEFLDRHHSTDSRAAYLRWSAAETDAARKKLALRQIVLDDFAEG